MEQTPLRFTESGMLKGRRYWEVVQCAFFFFKSVGCVVLLFLCFYLTGVIPVSEILIQKAPKTLKATLPLCCTQSPLIQ